MNETLVKEQIETLAHEIKPTDAQIESALSLAINDIASKIDLHELQRTDNVTVTSGEGTLPSRFQRMIGAWYTADKIKLIYQPLYEFDKDFTGVGTVGVPRKYTLWGNSLLVYPKIASASIFIRFIQAPSGLRSLDDRWTNLVIKRTLAELFPYGSEQRRDLFAEYRADMSTRKPRVREKKTQMTLSEERKRRNVDLAGR